MSELVIVYPDIVLNTKFANFLAKLQKIMVKSNKISLKMSGRESGVGGSPNSVADNGGCVATGEATTGSVTWLM